MNLATVLTIVLIACQSVLTLTELCTITSYVDVKNVTATCVNITIGNLEVPAGETMLLDLLDGATVTFTGNVTFGYVNWTGPLIRVYGSGVTIQGEKGKNTFKFFIDCFFFILTNHIIILKCVTLSKLLPCNAVLFTYFGNVFFLLL